MYCEVTWEARMKLFNLIKSQKLALVVLFYNTVIVSGDPTRQTTCGPVEGISKDGVFSFRGIPYAEPPIGKLRWKPPKALSKQEGNCWSGTFRAKTYGNTCFQRDTNNISAYLGSEDCLYINVITPTLDTRAQKPVMVWIHGGFLEELNANWPTYSPTEQLAKETDVVYVGFNYRLQAFGFMALELLAEDSPTNTSGNYGFMDMILALQWVQQNVANFGGDPAQVTVFGQSSGGTAIFALLASPLCQGLFHKAWMISGSPLMKKTAAEAYKDNEIFMKNALCTTLSCLYALTAAEVTSAVPWDTYPFWSMADQNDPPIKNVFDGALAIVDGYVLKQSPFDAWASDQMVDVPVLIGSTANEADYSPVEPDIRNWTWADYEENVHRTIGTFGEEMYKQVMKLYPPNYKTPEYQFTSLVSDVRVNCPTDFLSRHAAMTFKSKIYRYVVTSDPSQPIRPVGLPFYARYAFHLWDVFAFFGSIKDYIKSPTQEDLLWQKNVRDEVLSFVHYGHPKTVAWQPYPAVTADFSSTTTPVEGYHTIQCEFWLNNGFYQYAWVN